MIGRNADVPRPGFSTMARAIFDGVVIAESDDIRTVEGIAYFPIDSVNTNHLVDSPMTSRCFWKGRATYWHVSGDTDVAQNAAFAYRRPWPLARRLVTDRVAFWRGVTVEQ